MDIVPIFPENKPAIFSARYEGESLDELGRLFDLWSDVEYLESFFEENKADLCGGYIGCPSVEEAVNRILDDAERLEDRLFELAEEGESDPQNSLQTLFSPLNNEMRLAPVQKNKAKIYSFRNNNWSWLRLYAIRIAPNLFVITGGAIKLTHRMEEREHTRNELVKLEKVKAYLQDQGLIHESDFQFLEI
jgi:hypothetical protein